MAEGKGRAPKDGRVQSEEEEEEEDRRGQGERSSQGKTTTTATAETRGKSPHVLPLFSGDEGL